MSLENIILILVVGIVAGFLNTVGGGGSLLTMPMLIFLGLPSAVANGTNRVGIVIQSVVAVWNFKRKGFFDLRLSLMLGIPALIGSIIGSTFAISLSDEIFNKILAVVMIVVLALIIKQPQYKFAEEEVALEGKRKITAMIGFFFVGFYGGFIQAGVGFIIIAALTVLANMSLVRINSLKVFIIGLYMFSSFIVFALSGNIDWTLGLALAASTSIGAWLGSNFAVAGGDKWIKVILSVTVITMAIKLLFNI